MSPICRAKQHALLGRVGFIGMMFAVAVGGVACQTKPVAPPPKPVVTHPPKRESAPKVVDTKAQQLNFDQGSQAYSAGKYEAAKAAFLRVVDLGAQSELGLKARESLKKVDAKLQQLNYDQGLKAYSTEKYEEAKTAFQRAIDLGPQTELGAKARENLKKVLQVLKTVEEIKAK